MKRLLLFSLLLLLVASYFAVPAEASCPGCLTALNIQDCVSVGGAIQKINGDGSVSCLLPPTQPVDARAL